MIIYIDPSVSGISGDMLLGALLDLGAGEGSLHSVGKQVSKTLGSPVEIKIRDVKKKGIISKGVTVAAGEGGVPAGHLKQAITSLSKTLDLGKDAQKFSIETMETLLRAEEAVHGNEEELHLHELGSADTLVDILGAAKLAGELGFFGENTRVYSSPVLVGSGTIETSHGTMPVPAPATAEILRRFRIPFKFSSVQGELATPTGVAIFANLVDSFQHPYYPVKVESIGRGAGSFDFDALPNVLRIMVLSSEAGVEAVSALETSVDDVTGEVLGYVLDRLYDEGALDVQITPTVTKKNRPGYIIFVLCEVGSEEGLARVLMDETGTLGVRISPAQMRFISEREIKKVMVSLPEFKGTARVKVSYSGKKRHVKAEFEDAKKIAVKTGLPLKDVIKEIERRAT
jgi:hypothetical protein